MPIIQFDSFEFNTVSLKLRHKGESVELRPKSAMLLKLLIEHPEETLDKEHILKTIWSESCVSDGVIYETIKEIRKALNDTTRQSTFIKTIPKRGYQWIFPYQVSSPPLSSAEKTNSFLRKHRAVYLSGLMAIGLFVFGAMFFIYDNKATKQTVQKRIQANDQSSSAMKPTVAILPFINRSDEKESIDSELGLTEILINNLSMQDSFMTIESIDVITRIQPIEFQLSSTLTSSQWLELASIFQSDYIVNTIISGQKNHFSASVAVYNVSNKDIFRLELNHLPLNELMKKLNAQLTDRFVREGFVKYDVSDLAFDDFSMLAFAKANQYVLSRNPDKAKTYFNMVLEHYPNSALTKYRLADVYFELDNQPAAIKLLKEVIENDTKKDPILIARSHRLLGKLLSYKNEIEAAQSNYSSAYAIYDAHNSVNGKAFLHILFSRLAHLKEQPSKRRQELNYALQLYQSIHHLLGQGWTLEFLSDAARDERKPELQYQYLQRSLQFRIRAGNSIGEAKVYEKLAAYYWSINDTQQAYEHYLKAEKTYGLIGDAQGIIYNQLRLSSFNIQQNNFSEALPRLELAKKLAQQLNNPKAIVRTKLAFAYYLEKTNNYHGAIATIHEIQRYYRDLGDNTSAEYYNRRLELIRINHINHEEMSIGNKNAIRKLH